MKRRRPDAKHYNVSDSTGTINEVRKNMWWAQRNLVLHKIKQGTASKHEIEWAEENKGRLRSQWGKSHGDGNWELKEDKRMLMARERRKEMANEVS